MNWASRNRASRNRASQDRASRGRATPLFDLHAELGARMTVFAGYALPLRYGAGTVAEHRATRAGAGLFDVSHLGIVELAPARGGPDAAQWLERWVPSAIVGLEEGRMRYTMLTTPSGGIYDDLIVLNLADRLRLVVNAARTQADLELLERYNAGEMSITLREDLALLALQGPAAASVLARWAPELAELAFMSAAAVRIDGVECHAARCGYTGEDGFEIAVPAGQADHVARLLLGCEEVVPAGLGARDTLRLEAGLPLAGCDLSADTTPAEAGLGWAVPARRRARGGYPGAEVIAAQLAQGPPRLRVGIAGRRRPIRAGAVLSDAAGTPVGQVTSGGYGPTVDAPVAMAYVSASHAAAGTGLSAQQRTGLSAQQRTGGPEHCTVAALPFVEHHYWRPVLSAPPGAGRGAR